MKKICFVFAITILFVSCATTTLEKVDNVSLNEGEIIQENGLYKIKGKYNLFTLYNEEEVNILKNHPLVLNAKYNFIKDMPEYFVNYSVYTDNRITFYTYNRKEDVFEPYETKHDKTSQEQLKDLLGFYNEILKNNCTVDETILQEMKDNNLSINEWRDMVRQRKKAKEEQEKEEKKRAEREYVKNNYTQQDLLKYMSGNPYINATLPNMGKSFTINGAILNILDAALTDSGVNYLVNDGTGNNLGNCIYINGKNLKTFYYQGYQSFYGDTSKTCFEGKITLTYSGETLPAIVYGERVNVPLFIANE